MTPAFRGGLALILTGLVVLFGVDPVQGQRVRPRPITQPPKPIIFQPPPVMPGPMEQVWTCPNCKRELGRGMMAPASVTCCGITYINGHSRNNQLFAPTSAPTFSPAASSAASTVSGVVIFMGIGLILFGLLVLGGVGFLVMQSMGGPPRVGKRRRPRRED